MDSRQNKQIWGIAHNLGMSPEDLHNLCQSITGCYSLKELDDRQTAELMAELNKRQGNSGNYRRKNVQTEAGMMTAAQQALAWRYIYRLIELDPEPSKAQPGERMVGAIKKAIGVTADIKAPFKWIRFDDGIKLIETLKRYVVSAERKARKNDGGGSKKQS